MTKIKEKATSRVFENFEPINLQKIDYFHEIKVKKIIKKTSVFKT